MRALVAGGAGFIGSHLCDLLLKHGFEVICVDSLITGSRRNIAHLLSQRGFAFQHADITEPLQVKGRIDVVFHLASPASPRDYLSMPIETLDAGGIGTRNLLELSLRRRAVFVLASTSEIYGDPDRHPQTEDYWGNVNPVGVRSAYDEAKRFAEAQTAAWHRRWGLSVRIARIFNTYGPRMKLDDGRVVPNLIHQALRGQPLTIYGTGRQTRSFCYCSDLVDGLLRLAASGDAAPINLGNPREFTILQFARLVKKLTDSKSPLEFKPLPEDDPRRRRPDIRRARTLLGWQPRVDLETGLRHTIDWFRHQQL